MIQARRDSAGHAGRPPRRGRPLGLLFALLVMCLAVVPHVTLAASMMRVAMPGHAHAAGLGPASLDTPCHEDAGSSPVRKMQAPCCMGGCGLIAEAPSAAALRPVAVAWSRATPPPAVPVGGLTPEPAEHPPRSRVPLA